MNINDFPEMQQAFTSAVRRYAKNVQPLAPRSTETLPLEFLKTDYSSIAQGFPVSRVRSTFNADDAMDTWVGDLEALLRLAVKDSATVIYCSPLYLDYNPECTGLPSSVAFDIAAVSYDGTVVSYPILTCTRGPCDDPQLVYVVHEGRDYAFNGIRTQTSYWHFGQYSVAHKYAKHTLLKKQAVEINVWLPNIISDISRLQDPSAEVYLRGVREELDNKSYAARLELNRLMHFASLQDQVLRCLSDKTTDGKPSVVQANHARNLIVAVIGVSVDVELFGGQVLFVIDGQKVPPNELFNYTSTYRSKTFDET
jgi:hypothetical protein